MDVKVAGNYLYVADFELDGLDVINISNPLNPKLIGNVDTPGQANSVYLSGNYAYVADGWAGLQIVNISNTANLYIAGSIDTPGEAWQVYVSENYAYLADGESGLQIIDVSNPTTPFIAGNVDTLDTTRGVFVSGNYAYLANGSLGLLIIDISNPVNPTVVGSVDTPGDAYSVSVYGNYAYVIDGYKIFGKFSGLNVIDITDPSNPVLVNSIDTPGSCSRVFVNANYVYVSDGYLGFQIVHRLSAGTACEPVNFVNSTTLTAVVPSGLRLGRYNIKVANSLREESILQNGFIVLGTPPQENQAPIAEAGSSPKLGGEYLPVNFDGSLSYDTDGIIVSYQWNFGDGTTGDGVKVNHNYNSTGVYTVTLTVTDNRGDIAVDSVSVIINKYQVFVNCGGEWYRDTQGKLWRPDQKYDTTNNYSWGWIGGGRGSTTDTIANTLDDVLYQTWRRDLSSYQFNVPNGTYEVTLKFAELYWTRSEGRIFDVSIEGNLVLDNYDIYVDAGHDTAASDKIYNVTITDGRLDIEFTAIRGNTVINAIYLKRK
ncbi:MAG: PKD domain-containing protein [Candidatus Firestonebacteria bacterium]|nr:PKD domain-containing protein [Candidatus Firestonebacteria bacterium]